MNFLFTDGKQILGKSVAKNSKSSADLTDYASNL